MHCTFRLKHFTVYIVKSLMYIIRTWYFWRKIFFLMKTKSSLGKLPSLTDSWHCWEIVTWEIVTLFGKIAVFGNYYLGSNLFMYKNFLLAWICRIIWIFLIMYYFENGRFLHLLPIPAVPSQISFLVTGDQW